MPTHAILVATENLSSFDRDNVVLKGVTRAAKYGFLPITSSRVVIARIGSVNSSPAIRMFIDVCGGVTDFESARVIDGTEWRWSGTANNSYLYIRSWIQPAIHGENFVNNKRGLWSSGSPA